MSLITNLWAELVFFIPEKNMPKNIMDSFQGNEIGKLINKVLVMDTMLGPTEYKIGRNNKNVILKASKLDRNIYELLEKKSNTETSKFNYILEKYYEQVECLCYITNWMNMNLEQVPHADDTIKGLFHLQFSYYKKHLEAFLKHLYPNREAIPTGNFNIVELIETYLPNISKQYIKTTEKAVDSDSNIIQDNPLINKSSVEKVRKQSLITEKQAEVILLDRVFNLDLKRLK